MPQFEIKVIRDVPAYQVGVATVEAKSRKVAEQMATSQEDGVRYSWEEPDVPTFGDGEAGDIEILPE